MARARVLPAVLIAAVLILIGLLSRPYLLQDFSAASDPRPVQPRGDLTDTERRTIELFDRVSPSVVQVVAGHDNDFDFAGPDTGDSSGLASGTGFLWDEAGNIVTNAHVVGGAKRFLVRTASGRVFDADLVGAAVNYDVAVLKVSARNLPAAFPIGTSSDLQVGQSVFAIGNPFGLDQSLSTGVISALKRRLPTSGGREIADVIQTDAAINPGNSGGPLLDSAGRLIGVNTAIISPSGTSAGIGFAIPVDIVNRIVPELIRKGRVPTPGIGIVAASEAMSARAGKTGVVIVRTIPGLPAERAGLRGGDLNTGALGDVIVSVEGRPVRKLSDLTDRLEQIQLPGKVQLTVERAGSNRTVSVDVVDVSRE